MKKTIILLLIIPQFLFSQKQFAPLDATWRYDVFTTDCTNNFLRYNVEKEIEIDGKDCSVIYSYTSTELSPFVKSADSLIVWEDDQKVYFYQNGAFHLLFDFDLEAGDTFEYFMPYGKEHFSPMFPQTSDSTPHRVSLYVNEVEEVDVNGTTLKKFITEGMYSNDGQFNNMGEIIENVGSTQARLLGQDEAYIAIGCGPNFLCYENENYSYPPDINCEYPTSTKNIYSDNEIRFYPNPTFGNLIIENNTREEIQKIEIINMSGQKVDDFISSNTILHLDNLLKGIYIIKLKFDSGINHISKIVKY